MSNPFVAEIRIFAGNFAPRGWALCNGQLMPISQNTALFSLLGTTYGGDGKSNFALPNLQGCAPMFNGQGPGLSLYDLGETGGEVNHTLLATENAVHAHNLAGDTGNASSASPAGGVYKLGRHTGTPPGAVATYTVKTASDVTLNPQTLAFAGGSQPHNNMMPYLTLTFIIALQGVFPPRS